MEFELVCLDTGPEPNPTPLFLVRKPHIYLRSGYQNEAARGALGGAVFHVVQQLPSQPMLHPLVNGMVAADSELGYLETQTARTRSRVAKTHRKIAQ
jgi:hypothetical protein